MTELSQLIQWSLGGFWRWLGFAILVYIVAGWAHQMAASILGSIASRNK